MENIAFRNLSLPVVTFRTAQPAHAPVNTFVCSASAAMRSIQNDISLVADYIRFTLVGIDITDKRKTKK